MERQDSLQFWTIFRQNSAKKSFPPACTGSEYLQATAKYMTGWALPGCHAAPQVILKSSMPGCIPGQKSGTFCSAVWSQGMTENLFEAYILQHLSETMPCSNYHLRGNFLRGDASWA